MGSGNESGVRASIKAVLRQLAAPLSGNGRGLLGIAILAILLISAGFVAWSKWGKAVKSRSRYTLTAETFEITPQPPWIQSDVKADVLRDADLTSSSILEPDFIKGAVQAFELNTWVAKVLWAGKRPGSDGPRVIVRLQYREPIIMVRTHDKRWKGDCFWPVDTEGVFLPPAEFSASQTRGYLRVDAGNTLPVGAVGTPYGDPSVAGAARIASHLRRFWQVSGLKWIMVKQDSHIPMGQPIEPTYELLTDNDISSSAAEGFGNLAVESSAQVSAKAEVIWGHATGREPPNEASSSEKCARLERFVQEHGSLDQLPPTTVIDLRPKAAISVINRNSSVQSAAFRSANGTASH